MFPFKADLHIHTVLSPCGSLDMSPVNIINKARQRGIAIIGITDHNATKQCKVVQNIGKKHNITVLAGAEVTSKEEVHSLAFFETDEKLKSFQNYLDNTLPDIENKPDSFGYQVVVNEDEIIEQQEETLLISALNVNMDEIAEKVYELQGIFIPAHIDRMQNSVYSQLGMLPPDLQADGLEISRHISASGIKEKYPETQRFNILQNSDAHYPDNIGEVYTTFYLEKPAFSDIKHALKHGLIKK